MWYSENTYMDGRRSRWTDRWMGADGHRDGWMDEYMDRDGKMTVQTDGQIDPGPAVPGAALRGLRAPSPFLDPGATSLERSFSLRFPREPHQSPEPGTGSKLPRAVEAESCREVIFGPRILHFLNPSPPPKLGK